MKIQRIFYFIGWLLQRDLIIVKGLLSARYIITSRAWLKGLASEISCGYIGFEGVWLTILTLRHLKRHVGRRSIIRIITPTLNTSPPLKLWIFKINIAAIARFKEEDDIITIKEEISTLTFKITGRLEVHKDLKRERS
ncbi:hypothetical protein N7448_006057 [Penicillium atrosanguineum]|uniref:Stomatin-like protein 2 n=1 Tax=Penicillium atrosanguineum TaxID=1132637 RepID=UPI0023A697ED|nr:Stomatin-like protein 2 [Penicillium atrosanguineum]KAJ5131899.1 hypothetical protein N7448_006057 [Penicillium atrosanguineum]KAJ5289564.1 Stomatin-like protein 2 [Penicillium atrosanguineum]